MPESRDRPMMWVDAFADRPFGGNPCAVVFDADAVDLETRLAFTRETRLSECVFLQASDRAAFGARYYTAAGEILLAGHPTVATIIALIAADKLPAPSRAQPVETTLEIGAGVLPITVEAPPDGGPPRVEMVQPAPAFGRYYAPIQIAELVGLEAADVAAPPRTVDIGGTRFCVTLLQSKDALRRARLDAERLEAFRADADFREPFLATLGGATPEGDTFSRLLLAPPEPAEDPFTGSATGCLAAYLWSEGLIETPRFVAEQGHDMDRPGRAWVEILGPRAEPSGVKVAGQGVVLMRGAVAL
ncbi:MAG: PhzF family phenazine biosynthesis protein [Pseudomonadota bacterium]